MIKNVEIENFRCFGKSKFSGFSRINLIGGKNNAGKTAFLEALYLNNSPQELSVMHIRGIDEARIKSLAAKAWNNLFLDKDKKAMIAMQFVNEEHKTSLLEISMPQSKRDVIQIIQKLELSKHFFKKGSDLSLLQFNYQVDNEFRETLSLIAHSDGFTIYEPNIPSHLTFTKIAFCPSDDKLSSKHLAEQYDLAYINHHSDKLLKVFQIIDPSIEDVRTLNIGEPSIYLQRKNEEHMPLSLFGDSLNRATDFLMKLVNNQNGILLIDEIENGFHHTSLRELWRLLFDLTAEFNVQIFATTHSLEMLQAFTAVSSQIEDGEAGYYFEFARHIKTSQIIGIKYEMDVLEYGLKRQKGVRGE
ncbi:ATPase-like protein [Candidatus Thiomargarita nelsonii]|uniref:ATPase-like protein n=1 Tax=Candidatus Thiomargarita nelsonii TaxID=1003181 RepID=A0A0A6P157_9GAMM|nr:ATPase-like protein [Candidatus Thiomargarita nelsonii]